MAIIRFAPLSRQAARPQHKFGIVGMYFTWMSPERQAQRRREMVQAGFPQQLVAAITKSTVIMVRR